ncbi:peptide chain release factor 2 [Ruoffia tabacinasalis]|uniref:Peptide chain release factor 2 n=1 Tax=Ruoffia tabacinasalis TaxID=87458 RepID=A0A5R9DSS1_9LACT|nr:peptide chain release factor 2 [Ruoffia tabacinasalis]
MSKLLKKRWIALGGLFDLDALEADIADYEYQMSQPDFWDDNEVAQEVIQELNSSKETYQTISSLEDQVEELTMALELYNETKDEEMYQEAGELTEALSKAIDSYEIMLLLSGEYDKNDAILEIHPGAGGTESQDWGSMLLRMYQRYADHKGFSVEVLDYQAGDEAGIKSVVLEIKGHNAYGLLKSEKGVHRLVRISPFDSNARRHTSFASIEVTPLIDQSVEININPDDIRIDTYRASGAGGQHVNKTDSAVRITHIPTGVVTQSQAQRSQLQNREQAMKLLKSKLHQLEVEQKAKELAEIKGDQKEIGWGSQIRSYVFHPYSMVKDHRTNYEVGNTDKVMDGDLDDFIDAYLKWSIE